MANATEIKDIAIKRAQCDLVVDQAEELKALFSFNSEPMIVANKVRALSAIDAAMSSLRELQAYIKSVQG